MRSSDEDNGAGTINRASTTPHNNQSKKLPHSVAQSMPEPALNSGVATPDLTADELASGADLSEADDNGVTSSGAASSNLSTNDNAASMAVSVACSSSDQLGAIETAILPQSPLNDIAASESKGQSCIQEPAASSAVDTSHVAAHTNPIASLLDLQSPGKVPLSDSVKPDSTSSSHSPFRADEASPLPKTPAPSATTQAHDVSHGSGETSVSDNRPASAPKSDLDVSAIQVSAAETALPTINLVPDTNPGNSNISSDPTSNETTTSQQINPAQESAGVTRQAVDTTAGTKVQTRKDGLLSSVTPQGTDQSDDSASAKGIGLTPPSSLAAIAPPSPNGDSSDANAGLPSKANDQDGHSNQDLTGAAQNLATPESTAAYPAPLISSAKLIERIGEAELRLGIRAGEFGSVDIRTSMVRNQLTAEISVERGELGRVMAAELSGLQTRLSEQRIPVANITVQNHTGGQSTAAGEQKPRDEQQISAPSPVGHGHEGVMAALISSEVTASTTRLDIHM